ncbi:ROK family protein [Oceanobacillus piezotolerans]|uniref:fructokinase n=1 Tax=Oceanobacillus piezotolerans TaxID=2448030 RepID=A0A498DAG2_9BACI|nr:ROK family protein [Oceanobacillus piezotolerans]RLL41798.1 ROK family protein [Oceanobacillus piezotolerans]
MRIGGIEAGGTKFVCAVSENDSQNIIDKVSFPTGDPEETLDEVKDFFKKHQIEAVGVASFGPVDLNKKSKTYGSFLNTPKEKWKDYPLLDQLKTLFDIPVFLDTDVNAACLAEYKYGAGKGADTCLYITVGTGLGAGLVQNGEIYQGKNHSEMGHVIIKKHHDDPFNGCCPYHGSCIEGMASGLAIEKRYGKKGIELTENNRVWEIEAYYLAQAIMNYYVVLIPEKVILGGGVLKQEKLYPLIRSYFTKEMNGYLDVGSVDELIVAPELNDEQGVIGAMELIGRSLS